MEKLAKIRVSPGYLRRYHRASAIGLAAFIALHLLNHLALLIGPEAHIAVQNVLRRFYRAPFIEPLLLGACALQVLTGLKLAWSRRWPPLFWHRLQLISGLLIAAFLAVHVSAALFTRATQPDIDTTVYWAAAVVSRPAFAAFFAPYYLIGVAAVFAHLAAFMALKRRKSRMAQVIFASGVLVGGLIVAGLMGVFGAIDLPPAYQTYLDTYGAK
ncbi:MAG: hypothetical protein ACRBCL_04855 [Maritimibacter sp.]